MVTLRTALLLVVLGLALCAGCGSQPLGSLVVGIKYTGGAWHGSSRLTAGRVPIFDERGHVVRVLRVNSGLTATAQLPPGHYRLGFGHGRPTVKRLAGCQPEIATVNGARTTNFTLRLGCWPSTPKGVLASVVAAGLAQKSVHAEESFGADLFGTVTWTVDAGVDSGDKVLDYYGSKLRSLLVDHTIYVRADASLVDGTLYTSGLGLSDAQTKRYAGKWISIPEGDKLYAGLADGLTLASTIHDATVSRFYSLAPPHDSGEKLAVLRQKSHGARRIVVQLDDASNSYPPMEMTARGNGTPLPVSFYAGCGMVCGTNGTFSKWNEPLHITKPAHSTPIATVRGS